MKFPKAILPILVVAFSLAVAGDSFAQESSTAPKQKTQMKKKQQKRAKKRTFMEAVEANISDLTEEQKNKLDALQKEASASHKEIHKKSEITWQMSKKRQEIFDGMSTEKSYKERNAAASKQAGYSEDQIKALQSIGTVYYDFRFNGMKVLTEAQQAKMPKWYQDEFKKASEAAAKKVTKEKAVKK